jgi:hypothetical protein
MTSMMTILNIEARPADPDQLILKGLKKSAHRYLLYLPISYVLAKRVEYMKDTFASASSKNLGAGRVVLWVLLVPWCHACEFDALTRITFPDLQQLLLALVL